MTEYSSKALSAFALKINERIAELDELKDALGDAADTVTLDQSKVGRLSRMDTLQRQAMAQETIRRRQIELVELQKALARIEDGSFGECKECLEPINPKRITHNPAVSLCLACAEAAELDS